MQRSPNHEPLAIKSYSLPTRQINAIAKIAKRDYSDPGRANESMAAEQVIDAGLKALSTTS